MAWRMHMHTTYSCVQQRISLHATPLVSHTWHSTLAVRERGATRDPWQSLPQTGRSLVPAAALQHPQAPAAGHAAR